ncbi:MAG: hypothetical protein P4L87_06935, partial [Formivibrio sp.]|nr:hypothetical protein [Formivibrio sp.]
NRTSVTDGRGNTTYSYYDGDDRLVLSVDADGFATRTAYYATGQVASVTHYATAVSGTYNASTPPTISPSSNDATTNFTYDAAGRLTATTDAAGHAESYGLDAFGDRTQVTNKIGGVTTYTYDAKGNLLTETMAWATGTASMLANGTAEAATVTNAYGYDAFSNRILQVEAQGLAEARTTTYVYDNLNRLTSQSVSLGAQGYASTLYQYDSNGNVVQSTDPNGNKTYSYYDALNRKTAQVNALGVLTTYAYDNDSNLSTETVYATPLSLVAGTTPTPTPPSGGSRTTTYYYDGSNRLTATAAINITIGWWGGSSYVTSTGSYLTSQFVYDAVGNVIKSIDANGYNTYNYYDANNNKIAKVDSAGCLTTYSYDANGNVTQEYAYANKVNTQSGATVALGTSTAVAALVASSGANSQDRITQFTYDLNGNRLTETRLNVAAYTQGTGDSVTASTTASSTITYAYNALGEVNSKQEAAGDTTAYAYDSQGRLITTTTATGQVTSEGYDGLNNVTRSVSSGANSATRTTTYTYGAGGRLASMTGAGVNAAETRLTTWYTYDLAGNLIQQSQVRNAVDAAGAVADIQTVYQYDALNRQISQQSSYLSEVTQGSATGATWVAGDTDGVIYNAYGAVAATTVNGTRTTQFVYDNAGHLIASNSGDGTWKAYVTDSNGNATLVIQSAGTQDLTAFLTTSTSGSGVNTIDTSTFNQTSALALATNNGANAANAASNTTITTTSASSTISYSGSALSVGQTVSGVGIPAGTTVTSVNTTQKTAVLSSAATASGSFTIGVLVTVNTYDQRNEALGAMQFNRSIDATGATYTIATSEGYDAFGDVTSQTDARGNTTTYQYNTLGKQAAQISPQVAIANGNGNSTTGNPTTYNYYDISGRLIATRDADGNLNTQVLQAGTGYGGTKALAAAVYHPDGGIVRATYDVYGDALTQTDAMGNVTSNIYDNSGNLIQVIQPASTTNTDGTTGGRTSVVTTSGSTAVSFSAGGDLWVGEGISGNGVATGTVVATVNAANGTATLSAVATASGTVTVANQLVDYYSYDGLGEQVSQSNNLMTPGILTGQPATFGQNGSGGAETFTVTLPTNPNMKSGSIVVSATNLASGVTLTGSVSGGVLTLNYSDTASGGNGGGNANFTLTQNGAILYQGTISGIYFAKNDYYNISGQVQAVYAASGVQTTAYDAQGRVISTTDYRGYTVNYAYRWNGALATNGLGTYGGWTKTTTDVDAGETSSDTTDAFGHEITKTDLGSQIYSFTYNKAGELVAQSTSNPLNAIQILGVNASLTAGQKVYSQNSQFYLTYQTDGNLVVYGPGGAVLWASGTSGNAPRDAIMQDDGNLVVYNSSGSPNWASGTVNNSGATLFLTNNGQLEIISATKSLVWSTPAYSTPVGGTGGENLKYAYYNTGKIASITDNSNAITGYYGTTLNSKFTYDQNGNR